MTVADPGTHPGEQFGLPADGVGSVASLGTRMSAFVLDLVLSALIALAFTRPELPQNWSLLVWAVMTILAVGLFGFTPGQGIMGIRVASVQGKAIVGLWAIPRTALTFLIIPPLVVDKDGRGIHDRVCRTVVLRMR